MNKKRNTYHTSVKTAFQLGLLPDEIMNLIPRTTLHRFKNTDYSHIFGYEFASLYEDQKTFLKDILHCKTVYLSAKAIIQIKNTIIKIHSSITNNHKKMEAIVSTINSVKETIGLDRALEQFSISRSTFYSWSHQLKHYCFDSFIGKCVRRWPNQLSKSTLKTMKNLCEEKRFTGWPMASIAYFARRHNIVSVSLQTWYKYAPLIGFKRQVPKCRKKYRVGIRTDAPHKFWHADVTIFKTQDNRNAFISFIVDNFSRAVLAWDVSLYSSAKITLDTIKEAYYRYIHPSGKDVSLIVYGGPENNNSTVDEFLNDPGISVKKLVAGRDIHFSNSMVEAVNKLVKYRHLFLHDIPDIDALVKHLGEFIPIYNKERPHISLKGLTPFEVLGGMNPENENDLIKVNLKSKNRSFQRTTAIECSECL